MKLEKITIENFRQYYQKQQVVFSTSKEKNVTVIHGINGTGKTSFFSAINWCLYGGNSVAGIGELINKRLVEEAKFGDSIHMQVELAFSHHQERYRVRRSLSGRKDSDSVEILSPTEDFNLMRIDYEGQAMKIENPVGQINSILPENVRTYFLFDGEKIDRFARPESAKDVKYAIYNVLKLELLDRARKHLSAIAKEYRSELKSVADDQLKRLLEQIDQKTKEKENAAKEVENTQREIAAAEEHIRGINEKLENSEGVKDLQQKRTKTEKEIKDLGKELITVIAEVRTVAINSMVAVTGEMLPEAIGVLDQKRRKGEIPGNIRQQFLEDLIGKLECICGRPLVEHGEEYRKIKSMITSSVSSTLEEEVTRLASQLRVIQGSQERERENLGRLMARRAEIRQTQENRSALLSDISLQLAESPLEDISKLEEKRANYKEDLENCRVEKKVKENEIKRIEGEIKDLEKEARSARKAESKAKILSDKMDLTQQSADAIDAIYANFADDMRVKIENHTNEIFAQLIWKEDQFSKVQLGDDYKLAVIDRWGKAAESELSAGERQVLSLSFIASMAKVSGEEAPLVMDTPFGRLSSAHREAITAHIPELADQLIIFVTDEELTGETRTNLLNRTGKEYQLNFNDATGCTEIMSC
ncbi:MAG: AAA family ATPase [Bacteroidota bacterium]